jgi:hypothetical protein
VKIFCCREGTIQKNNKVYGIKDDFPDPAAAADAASIFFLAGELDNIPASSS